MLAALYKCDSFPLSFCAGMAFGLFLSAVCRTETAAVQAAMAMFYPTLLLSGTLHIWRNQWCHAPLQFLYLTPPNIHLLYALVNLLLSLCHRNCVILLKSILGYFITKKLEGCGLFTQFKLPPPMHWNDRIKTNILGSATAITYVGLISVKLKLTLAAS